ncbi:hypothetical protein MASR2M18_11600 [Ignavibacteria bacterium]|nr:hypothetical protein [Bacteroidota bacterium]MCZ2132379.1 hypothetical protein [Bacteroidota bacterium]
MVARSVNSAAIQIAAIFLAFVSMFSAAFAAEPYVKVPPYPTKAEMERYEDNEEMFAVLLLDYYRTASILEAQLRYWDVKPAVPVATPTLDEITSQEAKTLKKFYGTAAKLQAQIEALPEEELRAHVRDVEKRLKDERKKNVEMQAKNFELELKSQHVDSYSERIYEFARQCDKMKSELDSMAYLYYMLKYSSSSALARALDDSFVPSLMLSNSGHLISVGENGINTDISYGAKAELNLNSFYGFGKYIDLWFAYLMPQIKSNPFHETAGSRWREWNSNIYSFGLNLNLPDVIAISSAKAGIKIGGGYYWGSATSPNIGLPDVDYKGQVLNLELNFSKFTTISPASLYFNLGVLFPSRSMIYSDINRNVNIGKSTITTFGLGLRFNVL